MNIAVKSLTLAGMLSTVAWFFWNPIGWVYQWEPVVVFLLTLAGFVASEITGKGSNKKIYIHPNDINLFKKFLEVMPSGTFIEFLKQHDFMIEFERDDVAPLRRFINEWDNAEYEFQDPVLERLRKKLLQAGIDFSSNISMYTSRNRSGFQSVRTDEQKHIEKHEERFRKEAAIIDAASDEFVRIHQELVREGLKKGMS